MPPRTRPTRPRGVPAGVAERKGRPAKQARRGLSPARRWTLRLSSVVLIAVAWEIYGSAINPVLLSAPSRIAAASVEMVADGSLTHRAW